MVTHITLNIYDFKTKMLLKTTPSFHNIKALQKLFLLPTIYKVHFTRK